jgi:putative membrane protein
VSAPDAPHFDAQPSASNHFAWMRTQMALQRTLLAAVRTAVSLIGFGFTVAQFFEKLVGHLPSHVRKLGPDAPRDLGLTLIAAGVISLMMFTWQYRQATKYLRSGAFAAIISAQDRSLHTSSYMVAFVVMAIGVAAFGSVWLRF